MKKFFQENKVLFLLAIIIISCFVIICISLVTYFYTGSGESAYGNRLEGIEKVQIKKDIDKKISKLYESEKSINNVKVNIKGKIVYITIDIKGNPSFEDAKNLSSKSLDAFSKKEKEFYDFQLIVTNKTIKEENKLYPFMGYKNSKSKKITWTNVGK